MSWGSRGEPQPNDSVAGGGELGLHSLEFRDSVSSATNSLRVHHIRSTTTPTPLPLLGQTREAELFYCYCITWPCSVIQKPIYSALFKAWGSDLAFVYGTLGTLATTWPT